MSDCNHEKRTLDYLCIDCGYDLIVDATEEKSRQREQERIIKLIEEQPRVLHDGLINANHLIALIKDETRNIRSEILSDGSIYIEEIKGESQKDNETVSPLTEGENK